MVAGEPQWIENNAIQDTFKYISCRCVSTMQFVALVAKDFTGPHYRTTAYPKKTHKAAEQDEVLCRK